MQNIATIQDLKSAIQQLEYKQTNEWVLLKEQFNTTYESLKPVNVIKSTLNELTKIQDFREDILNSTLSLATGYLSRKVLVGETHNPFKRLLGSLLQIGVTNIVSKNTDEIKSALSYLINNVFSKKEKTA